MMTDIMTISDGALLPPLSTLLDLLGAQMTEPERQALYHQILLLRPPNVAPGDLIRAETFNLMQNDINELMLRLARLEANAGGPYIDRIEPAGGVYATGSKITIVGRNLKPSNADTKVNFGTREIFDFFPESTDTHIVMPVPVGFTTLPVDLMVKVSTAGMVSNEYPVRIVAPDVVVQGTLEVTSVGGALGQINIGDPYSITWRITNQVTAARDIVLEKKVSEITGSSEGVWLDAIKLSDDGPFTIQPGKFKDVTMDFVVPTGADMVTINLLAKTTQGNFSDLGDPMPLKVGATSVLSDPRSKLAPRSIPVGNPATAPLFVTGIVVSNQTIPGYMIQPTKAVNLPLDIKAEVGGGGFFALEATVEPGTDSNGVKQNGRWALGAMPSTRISVSDGQTQPFTLPLASSATADTSTISWLVVKAKHFAAASGGTSDFTSFTRIPLVGKS
jgi:hypothetical protein